MVFKKTEFFTSTDLFDAEVMSFLSDGWKLVNIEVCHIDKETKISYFFFQREVEYEDQ